MILTGSGIRHAESGKPWRHYDPTSSSRHWAVPAYLVEKYAQVVGEPLGGSTLFEKLDMLDAAGLIHWGQNADSVPNYKYYLNDAPGVPLQDIWAYQPGTEGCIYARDGEGIDQDVKWLSTKDRERLGYPTQKPEGVLDRIIRSSSREGDIVLDPFCGCGTAIAVAQRLNRRWIGIDITHVALDVVRDRFQKDFGGAVEYEQVGQPASLPDAEALFALDPHKFQWWVTEWLLGANQLDQKKGADRGIDGRLYFHEKEGAETRQAIISVKGGRTNAAAVRDLRGVVEREKAALGVFVTLRHPTQPMRREAASAGFYESAAGRFYPRLQILTVEELLNGKQIDYPLTSPGLARQPQEPEQLVLPASSPRSETGAAAPPPPQPRAVRDLVEDLLRTARIDSPPVRLEPILEQLNMELSARPNQREDALLVSMTPPELGPPSAWVVYYNPSKPETRRRFTLAHEVGHVLLHGVTHAAAARGGGGRFAAREREVERFAAELLMPARLVREAVEQHGANVETLRALFLVSRKAMEIRLRELGFT